MRKVLLCFFSIWSAAEHEMTTVDLVRRISDSFILRDEWYFLQSVNANWFPALRTGWGYAMTLGLDKLYTRIQTYKGFKNSSSSPSAAPFRRQDAPAHTCNDKGHNDIASFLNTYLEESEMIDRNRTIALKQISVGTSDRISRGEWNEAQGEEGFCHGEF
jgi:hypothetical protein